MGRGALPPPEAAPGALARAALDDCLEAFPFVELTVTGACMSPSLDPGEKVRIASVARHPPRLGDVVLLRQGGELRLHRLIFPGWRIAGLCQRTQADRSGTPDPRHPPARLLGTVIGVVSDSARPLRRGGAALRTLARALAAAARAKLPSRGRG